ncbi:hypothetical protein M91_07251 [Bos mutus]|uniref:Uncharacterized protein n=1 Tax=Bos mutus TaxID=72004 RepID=L8I0Z6_9CETA|nr:hypothetical protein M91_07251 [Bos mutus]
MEKMEPSRQEVQPAACKASPPYSLESLSKKHCQNQGNLLHFDRQAPGRLTTSPTLRRLRSRGCGSVRGALEVRTWCDLQEYPGSASPLSNKVCESTEESSHSVWPLRLHSRLPLDSERALDSAESIELQMGPGEERALPVPQDLEEGSHPQASFPRKGDHSAPSHTPGPPGPQFISERRIASVQVCLYFLQCDESC